MWLKIKQEGLRRFWSMFSLTRVDLGTGFLRHNHISSDHRNGHLLRDNWRIRLG